MVVTFSFLCFRTTIYLKSNLDRFRNMWYYWHWRVHPCEKYFDFIFRIIFSLSPLVLQCIHTYSAYLKGGRQQALHKIKEMEGDNSYCSSPKGVVYTEYPRFLCRTVFSLIQINMMTSGSLHLVPLFQTNHFHRPSLLHLCGFALNVFLRKPA